MDPRNIYDKISAWETRTLAWKPTESPYDLVPWMGGWLFVQSKTLTWVSPWTEPKVVATSPGDFVIPAKVKTGRSKIAFKLEPKPVPEGKKPFRGNQTTWLVITYKCGKFILGDGSGLPGKTNSGSVETVRGAIAINLEDEVFVWRDGRLRSRNDVENTYFVPPSPSSLKPVWAKGFVDTFPETYNSYDFLEGYIMTSRDDVPEAAALSTLEGQIVFSLEPSSDETLPTVFASWLVDISRINPYLVVGLFEKYIFNPVTGKVLHRQEDPDSQISYSVFGIHVLSWNDEGAKLWKEKELLATLDGWIFASFSGDGKAIIGQTEEGWKIVYTLG